MKPHRPLRVGAVLKREIAVILRNYEVPTSEEYEPMFFTVTEVKPSRDLKYAQVWISVMGSSEERQRSMNFLKQNVGKIRYSLAQKVTLKHVPELRFVLDETLDHAEKIDSILKSEGLI